MTRAPAAAERNSSNAAVSRFSFRFAPRSRQLADELLIQDVVHRERHDDPVRPLEELLDLAERVPRVVEGDEEALLAALPHEHGLERVDVGPAGLVRLLHLNRIKLFRVEPGQVALAPPREIRRRGDREDATVDAHVADLRLVRDAAERDDGPVPEFEGRRMHKSSP